MRYKRYLKFPCGYEIKEDYSNWFSYIEEIVEIPNECPIHGKKCKETNSKV